MDRLASSLEPGHTGPSDSDQPMMVLGAGDEHLVASSSRHLNIPEELFQLKELDNIYEDSRQTLWTFMRPTGRPSFSPGMLTDFVDWQRLIGDNFGPGQGAAALSRAGQPGPGRVLLRRRS